jgi:hypothetical protein
MRYGPSRQFLKLVYIAGALERSPGGLQQIKCPLRQVMALNSSCLGLPRRQVKVRAAEVVFRLSMKDPHILHLSSLPMSVPKSTPRALARHDCCSLCLFFSCYTSSPFFRESQRVSRATFGTNKLAGSSRLVF